MFPHEKFEAYQLSIQFSELALELIDNLRSGGAPLKDQLRRAAFSISLNIAEGTGKTGRPDRKRFYAIARGTAVECAAVCDLVVMLQPALTHKADESP
ncbi:MAG: four helix bundle protein [Deltaproteobacteria bacterium]|nr:four helix bundle protein [Deltaproteobacteria bacterium]